MSHHLPVTNRVIELHSSYAYMLDQITISRITANAITKTVETLNAKHGENKENDPPSYFTVETDLYIRKPNQFTEDEKCKCRNTRSCLNRNS